MTAWIIEDEPPAFRRLTKLLGQVRPNLSITFSSDSIASCVLALETKQHPDVIFSDIHLADGLSFAIWEQVECQCPIIFTTAYDQYGVRAFKVNSIDYLMKPINAPDLDRALQRLMDRTGPTPPQDWARLAEIIKQRQPSYRERFLAQKGHEWLPLRVENLRQIYSSDGLTFALSTNGQRFLLDETLDRIEEELNPGDWFRINRAQIMHIDAVIKASPYFNHRLALAVNPAGPGGNIVSRQRVKDCKLWLGR